MKKYTSLPIFFDSKTLNVYEKETQEKYGISDVKYKRTQKKYNLELTIGNEIICYGLQNDGIWKLYRIRTNYKKGC